MKTIDELIKQLRCGEPVAQIEAADELRKLGERATSAWWELGSVARSTQNQDVRIAAYIALEKIFPGQVSIFEHLRTLDQAQESSRAYAADLIGHLDAARAAIQGWIDHMAPDEGAEDLETIQTVAEIGRVVPEVIADIVHALVETPSKRQHVGRALGLIGHTRSEVEDHVIPLLDDPDSTVRIQAVEILGEAAKVSAQSVALMLAAANKEKDADAIDAIEMSLMSIACKSNEAIDLLLHELLKDKGRTVDFEQVLGEAAKDSDYALERLSKLLTDPNPHSREKAANALMSVERVDTSQWLEQYSIAFRDPNYLVRRGAINGLCGAIGNHWKELIPVFRDALFDLEDETVRLMSAQALEAMGPRAKVAAPDLSRLCEQSSGSLKQAATDALDAVTADD